jgi:dTDP-4-dehydrorhamnose reductase
VALGHARGLCPSLPVHRISSAEYPTPARRPGNSQLSGERLHQQLGLRLPDWRQALALCLDDIAAARG